MNVDPIIVTGMHRSGTSLISEILILNGIFFGSQLDVNNESVYFQRINKWILSSKGCSWDNPESLCSIRDNDKAIICKKLSNVLSSRINNILYFGLSNLLFNKSFFCYGDKWGWKDPVNVFTLHIWKELFPELKIINIVRNPLDVSKSILSRQRKLHELDSSLNNKILSYFLPILSINKGDILSSFNINTVNDCLILYKKYLNQMNINNNVFGDNILNISYEQLLNNSEKVICEIFNFCNIPKQNLVNTIRIIDSGNINKYNYSDFDYDQKLLDDLDLSSYNG